MDGHRRAPSFALHDLRIAIVVVVTVCALGVGDALLHPRTCHSNPTQTDAMTMRGAVVMYLSEHPEGACPGVRDLLAGG